MKINSFTNYAFRVLIMLGANPDRTISLTEIAKAYDISLNHLKKVSSRLVEHGLVSTERGRSGGLRLLKSPSDIRLGEIFRISHPHKVGKIEPPSGQDRQISSVK